MQNKAVEVIRHSLAAASAALDLLDQVNSAQSAPVVQSVVEAAPVLSAVVEDAPVAEAQSAPIADNDHYDKIMVELDGDYDLRTVAELTAKVGLSIAQIKELLERNFESYVLRTRTRDHAPLIGLASRN